MIRQVRAYMYIFRKPVHYVVTKAREHFRTRIRCYSILPKVHHEEVFVARQFIKAKDNIRAWSISDGVSYTVFCDFLLNPKRAADLALLNNHEIVKFRRNLRKLTPEQIPREEDRLCANLGSWSLDKLISHMHAFLTVGHYPRVLVPVTLERLCYTFDQEQKSPTTVLLLIYIMGLYRSYPNKLRAKLQEYLLTHICDYTYTDTSVICFSFQVMNATVRYELLKQICEIAIEAMKKEADREEDATLREILVKDRSNLQESSDVTDSEGIMSRMGNKENFLRQATNITKCLNHSAFNNTELLLDYTRNLHRVIQTSHSLPFTTAMHIVRYLAARRIHIDGMYDDMCIKLKNSDADDGYRRTKDLFRLLWDCNQLNVRPQESWIEKLAEGLKKQSNSNKHVMGLIEGLTALTTVDVVIPSLTERLYEDNFRIVKKAKRAKAVDFYQICLFSQYLSIFSPENYNAEYDEHFSKEAAESNYECLPDILKSRIALTYVWSGLQSLLGPENITFKFTIRASGRPDMIIHLDERNQPVPIGRRYGENIDNILDDLPTVKNPQKEPLYLNGEQMHLKKCLLIPENCKKQRKICIRVLSKNQLFRNHPAVLGHINFENKLIMKMGYEIYMISPGAAHDYLCLGPTEREGYLRDILNSLTVIIPAKELTKELHI